MSGNPAVEMRISSFSGSLKSPCGSVSGSNRSTDTMNRRSSNPDSTSTSDSEGANSDLIVRISGPVITDLLYKLHRRSATLVDTHVICKDGYIPVHRCVLIASSKVLREHLLNEDPADLASVCLPDFSVSQVLPLINSFYTGSTLFKKSELNITLELISLLQADASISYSFQPAKEADKKWTPKMRHYLETTHAHVAPTSEVSENVTNQGSEDGSGQKDCEASAPIVEQVCGNYSLEEESTSASAADGDVGATDGDADEEEYGHLEDENERATDDEGQLDEGPLDEGPLDENERDHEADGVEDETKSIFEKLESMDVEVSNIGVDIEEIELSEGEYECDDGGEENDNVSNASENVHDAHVIELSPERPGDYGKDLDDSHSLPDSPAQSYCHFSDDDFGDSHTVDLVNNVIIRPDVHREHFSHQDGMSDFMTSDPSFEVDSGRLEDGGAENLVLTEGQNCIEIETTTFDENGECTQIAQIITETIPRNIFEKYHGSQYPMEPDEPYLASKARKNPSRSRRGSSVSKTSSEDSFKCPLPPLLFTRKVKKPKVTAATKAAEVRNRKEEILFSMQLEEEIRKSFEQAQLELLLQTDTATCERFSEDESESVSTSNGSDAGNNLEDGVEKDVDFNDSTHASTTPTRSNCDKGPSNTDVRTDDLQPCSKKLKRSAQAIECSGEDQFLEEDGGQVLQPVHSPPDQRKSCIVSNTRMKSKGEIKALPPDVNVLQKDGGDSPGVHPDVEVSVIESHKSEEEELRTSVNDSIRRLEDLLHRDVIEDNEPEASAAEEDRVEPDPETIDGSSANEGNAMVELHTVALDIEEPKESEEELEYRRLVEVEKARLDEEREKLERKAREEELERRRLEEERRIEEELNRQVELNMEMQKSEPENLMQGSSSLIHGISHLNRAPKSTKFYEDFVKKKLRVLQAAEELKKRQMSESGDTPSNSADDLVQEDCDAGFEKMSAIDTNLDRFEIVDYIPDAENEIVVENEEVVLEGELGQEEGKAASSDTCAGYESGTNFGISETEVSCTVSTDFMKIRLTKKKKLKVKQKHTQTKPSASVAAKPDSKTLVPTIELPKACNLMAAAQTLIKNPARRLEAQHNGKRYVIENPKIVIGKHDLLTDEDKKKYRLRLKNLKRSIQRQKSKQRPDTPPPTLTKAITSPKASTSAVSVLTVSSKPKDRSKEHKLLEKKPSKDDGCPPRLEPAYSEQVAHSRNSSTNGGHCVSATPGLVDNFPIASQPAFISSENLDWYQKALRRCAHCKRKYRTHSKASSCLANHGFRRCLICLDLVPSYDTMYEQHNYKFHEASKKGHVACPICGHLFTVSGLTTHVTRKHLKAESDTHSKARHRSEATESYEHPAAFINTRNENPPPKLNTFVNDNGKLSVDVFPWDVPFKPVGRVHLSESDDDEDDNVFQDKQPKQNFVSTCDNGMDLRTKFSLESLYAFKLQQPYDATAEVENCSHQAFVDFISAQKAFGLEPEVEVGTTSPVVYAEECADGNEVTIIEADEHEQVAIVPEADAKNDVIPDSPLDLQVPSSISRKGSCSSPIPEDSVPDSPAYVAVERAATPLEELQNMPANVEQATEPVTTDSPLSTSLSRTSSHEEISSPLEQQPRTPPPKPDSPPEILRPMANEPSTPSPETTIEKIMSSSPPIPASSPGIPSFLEIDKIPASEPEPTPTTSSVQHGIYEPVTSRQESNTAVNTPVSVPQHFDLQSYSSGHSMMSEASVITSHQSSKRHDPHPIAEIVQPKKRYLHLQQYGGPTANAMDYSRGYFSYPQSFTSLHSSNSASSHYSNAQDYRHNPMNLHQSSHDSLSQHILYSQTSSSHQFATPHLSHSSHHGSSSYHPMIHHHHSHQTHSSHHGHQYRHGGQSSYGGRNHSDKSAANSITMDESGSLICELNPVSYTASPIPIPRQSYNYGSSNAPKPIPASAFDSLATNAESSSSRPSRSIFSTPPLSTNADSLSVNNPIGYTTYNPSQDESSYRRTQHQGNHASSSHGHHLSLSSSQHSQSHQHQPSWESHTLRNLESTSLSLLDYADDLDDGPNDGTIRCERCRRCFYPAEFQAHNCS